MGIGPPAPSLKGRAGWTESWTSGGCTPAGRAVNYCTGGSRVGGSLPAQGTLLGAA